MRATLRRDALGRGKRCLDHPREIDETAGMGGKFFLIPTFGRCPLNALAPNSLEKPMPVIAGQCAFPSPSAGQVRRALGVQRADDRVHGSRARRERVGNAWKPAEPLRRIQQVLRSGSRHRRPGERGRATRGAQMATEGREKGGEGSGGMSTIQTACISTPRQRPRRPRTRKGGISV